jgi:hypothetical protein
MKMNKNRSLATREKCIVRQNGKSYSQWMPEMETEFKITQQTFALLWKMFSGNRKNFSTFTTIFYLVQPEG